MRRLKNIDKISASVALLLLMSRTQLWALGGGVSGIGGAGGIGSESRGLTSVGGRVLCARCDLEDIETSQVDVIGLYELQHRQGQIEMQMARLQRRQVMLPGGKLLLG